MKPSDGDLKRISDAANLVCDAPGLTAEIVMAFVSNNAVAAKDLPGLITDVHAALIGLADAEPAQSTNDEPTPVSAAEIRKSITPDALISFIDGGSYKTLRRHLTCNGYSPEQYRRQFGLPADYPLVASSYAAQRSALAKSIGLGRPAANRIAA